MLELGDASEDHVVLAFLRAEIDAPNWRMHYAPRLQALRLDRTRLIELADLSSSFENCARRVILGAVRGYGRSEWLFKDFPSDVKWRRALIEPIDFPRLKYISKNMDWENLSGKTRRVQDGARNLEANQRIAENVRQTLQAIKQGGAMAELVVVEADDGSLVLLEGHTRATAFAVLSDRAFPAFVGTSRLMSRWPFI